MTNENHRSGEPKTLEQLERHITETLGRFYSMATPGKTPQEFMSDVFVLLDKDPITDGDLYADRYQQVHANDKSADMTYAPMMTATAYCIQARRALKGGQRDFAWSYMAQACYWAGVVWASTGLEKARERTIQATRRHTAKKGGVARSEGKFRKLKDEAFRLAIDLRPQGGWPSRRRAALVIEPKVLEFSKAVMEPLSPDQALKTIDGWLRTMPDAPMLFQSRKQGKTGGVG